MASENLFLKNRFVVSDVILKEYYAEAVVLINDDVYIQRQSQINNGARSSGDIIIGVERLDFIYILRAMSRANQVNAF